MPDFSDIIGHRTTIEKLKRQLDTGKISHAYIISGAEGIGKMTLARAFARSLQTRGLGEQEARHAAAQADAGTHPDIINVTHEKQNVISVGEVRRQVVESVQIKPYSGLYKIYIIDEAEKLNAQAQNALLKTIEEPPAYAVIILLSENDDGFLPTVISRSMCIKLAPVPEADISSWLAGKHGMSEHEAAVCAAFSGGCPGRALMLSGDPEFREMRDEVVGMLASLPYKPVYEVIAQAHALETYKDRAGELLDLVLFWYADVLLYKAEKNNAHTKFPDNKDDIAAQADMISYAALEDITRQVERQRTRLASNVSYGNSMDFMWINIRENIK